MTGDGMPKRERWKQRAGDKKTSPAAERQMADEEADAPLAMRQALNDLLFCGGESDAAAKSTQHF